MDEIPLVDLSIQHAQIKDEVASGFDEVISSGAFVHGPAVAAFEHEYASFNRVRACVGVANGTDALELALRAVGVASGAAVVLPANTFIATAEAVLRIGARPVLVDCRSEDLLIDPVAAVEMAEQVGAAAVVPVDLFGQCAPTAEISSALDGRCPVVVDAAQSQGATHEGRTSAQLGVVASTSFYPGKNLGAYGDAGAVVSDDEGVIDRVRLSANHGSPSRYLHEVVGWNSRLDTLQAVVLRAKLARLEEWNQQRRDAAERYLAALGGNEAIELPVTAPGNDPVWHLFVVRVDDRDHVLRELQRAGVGAGIHYPLPLHLQPALGGLGTVGDFPVSEGAGRRILSLPIYPGITPSQVDRVVDVVTSIVA